MHTETTRFNSAGKSAIFGQHSLCNQKVGGSIPSAGTSSDKPLEKSARAGPDAAVECGTASTVVAKFVSASLSGTANTCIRAHRLAVMKIPSRSGLPVLVGKYGLMQYR